MEFDALSDMVDMIYFQVYLGEQYVNNPTLSDITFLVEGGHCSFAYIFIFFLSVMWCLEPKKTLELQVLAE